MAKESVKITKTNFNTDFKNETDAKPVYAKKYNELKDDYDLLEPTAGNISADTIVERTSGTGINIDGVLIKDGTVTTSAPLINSVDPAITATGTDNTDAYSITEEMNIITGGASTTGVILPTAVVGLKVIIVNLSGSTKTVYPGASDQIDDKTVTTGGIVLQDEDVVTLYCYTTVKWQSDFENDGTYGTLFVDTIAENTSTTGVTIDGVKLKDGGALTITGGTNTFNLTNGTASLDVAAGKAVDINDSLTVTAGYGITLTVEDVASTITLDEQSFEVEGEGTATRLLKLKNDTDAAITLTMGGDQDISTDSTTFTIAGQAINVASAGTAINILADASDVANAKNGIYISKDLANVSAVGALAHTEEALLIQSVNATSADANGALSTTGYLTSVQVVNSSAVAMADTYAGKLMGLSYSATTTGTGTATNSAALLEIDYNLTETAGTLSNTAFDVAYIDFDTVGTPAFASGSYNLLGIYGNTASSIDASATVTLSGLSVDLSGITVTDADMTLYGAYFNLPASGTSPYATIASYETFKLITTQDTKTITLNSRNYAATSGDIIGFQSKPAGNATGTQTVYGGQISPRFNDNVDGASLIGLQVEPILKGASVLALSGDMRALDVRLTSEGANTVAGDTGGIVFYNLLPTSTYTGGVFPIIVQNNGDTQAWTGLIKVKGALGTNTCTTATDKTGGAKPGTLIVYADGTPYHIQLYAN